MWHAPVICKGRCQQFAGPALLLPLKSCLRLGQGNTENLGDEPSEILGGFGASFPWFALFTVYRGFLVRR